MGRQGCWCLGKNTLRTDSDRRGPVPNDNNYPCIWTAWDLWSHWSNLQPLCCLPAGELVIGDDPTLPMLSQLDMPPV